MRTMMDDDPSSRSSRVTRQAFTVALVKPGRGNSRNPDENGGDPDPAYRHLHSSLLRDYDTPYQADYSFHIRPPMRQHPDRQLCSVVSFRSGVNLKTVPEVCRPNALARAPEGPWGAPFFGS